VSYTVGQVIYLLSRTEIKVYPAQVIEEIKRKTISEEIVSYVIKLPDKEATEVDLDSICADIFTSTADLENKMLDNAKLKIGEFLEKAISMASVFEPPEPPEPKLKEKTGKKRASSKGKQPEKDNDTIEVDLGGGIKGKIKMSELNA